MKILYTENLSKHYGKGESLVRALDNVDLEINEGEFVAIIGKSGSGKSTLLHMIGGLDIPTSGKVYIDNKNIFTLKEEELAVFGKTSCLFSSPNDFKSSFIKGSSTSLPSKPIGNTTFSHTLRDGIKL